MALIDAFPGGLVQEGGVGKRTPLHIVFTGKLTKAVACDKSPRILLTIFRFDLIDYVSLKLTKTMVSHGQKATFMKDKKGYLPLHVAVSRHVSPEKLRLLLDANPSALLAKTNDGKTALGLAKATATVSHPNFALIKALEEEIQRCAGAAFPEGADMLPVRVSSIDSIDLVSQGPASKQRRARKSRITTTPASKRLKQEEICFPFIETPAAANLLLHFSRNSNVKVEASEMEVAAVKVEARTRRHTKRSALP